MIKELSELGKKIREDINVNSISHDSLKEELISIVLTIKEDGSFVSIKNIDKKKTIAEAIQRTSGKEPRLLVDNIGYVIGTFNIDGNKYKNEIKKIGETLAIEKMQQDAVEKQQLFIKKLQDFSLISKIAPVILFYTNNKENGINKVTQKLFHEQISKQDRDGNVAFYIFGQENYVHEYNEVYDAIIENYESKQESLLVSSRKKCSICGFEKYPVGDFPHFPIKNVPGDKEPAGGRKLISYNGDNNPFESYQMLGNENCGICTQCAKTYVEGLNWLLNNGNRQIVDAGKGKQKEVFRYSNRKNFGSSDTAMVFWTRNNQKCKEIDLFDEPDAGEISNLFDSVTSGREIKHTEIDHFYSCSLSGAAARIAVRDWIELSLTDLRNSIASWFRDIAVEAWGEKYYSPLYRLVNAAQNEKNKNETTSSRIAVHLWNAALKNTSPPLWILTSVLKRIRIMENDENHKRKESITPERAALMRLVINRNNKGGSMIKERLDVDNTNTAYLCGRIFAVLESIQRAALGKDINAGIRERYFSFASTNPSPAFGRLMKMSQNHLTKLKSEKAGLAVILDKELMDLFCKINEKEFPSIFSLEEQGQFAIGYYHQKQDTFKRAKQNKDLKDAVEDTE